MRPSEMKKALCGSKLEFVPWLLTSSHKDRHPQGLSLLPHRRVGHSPLPPTWTRALPQSRSFFLGGRGLGVRATGELFP